MKNALDPAAIQNRFRTFLELYQAAEDLARQRFRREDPSRSAEEIQRLVVEWRKKDATTSLPGCRPSRRTFE